MDHGYTIIEKTRAENLDRFYDSTCRVGGVFSRSSSHTAIRFKRRGIFQKERLKDGTPIS